MLSYLKIFSQIKLLKKYVKKENNKLIIFDEEGLKNEVGEKEFNSIKEVITGLNNSL